MSIAAAAFSGVSSNPFEVDLYGDNSSSGLTVQPWGATPNGVGDLLITGLTSGGITSPSINDGFTVLDVTGVGSQSSATIAYRLAADTSLIRPTWTVGSIALTMFTDCVAFAHA
jgi:hypothetical protein